SWPVDDAVRELARDAGIAIDWIDAADQPHQVTPGALRTILGALGFPAATTSQITESRARLHELQDGERPLITGETGGTIPLPGTPVRSMRAELQLERGETRGITLEPADGTLVAPAIDTPGYHRLRFADREVTLAVAPPRCVTIEELAPGRKLFG